MLCYVQCKYSWLVDEDPRGHSGTQDPFILWIHHQIGLHNPLLRILHLDSRLRRRESRGLCRRYLWASFGSMVHHCSPFFHWPELNPMTKSF